VSWQPKRAKAVRAEMSVLRRKLKLLKAEWVEIESTCDHRAFGPDDKCLACRMPADADDF
jgi:hypothetical protein